MESEDFVAFMGDQCLVTGAIRDFLLLSFGPPLLDDCGLAMVMPT